jgi:hypothetical protein
MIFVQNQGMRKILPQPLVIISQPTQKQAFSPAAPTSLKTKKADVCCSSKIAGQARIIRLPEHQYGPH